MNLPPRASRASDLAVVVAIAALAACGQPSGVAYLPATESTRRAAPPAPPTWELARQWSVGAPVHSAFVAMDRDTLAVYARLERAGRTEPTLMIYQRAHGRWPEVQRLVVPQAGDLDFTLDMALDGDTLLVGRVVLARHDGVWAVEQDLARADDGTLLDPGGLSGDTIVARGDDHSVRVWVRTAGTWTQQQILRGRGGEDFAARGYRTVAIDRDVIAVGAFWGGPGRVYIYRRAGTRWSLAQRIEPPDDDGHAFGFAVAVDGDTAAIRSDGTRALIAEGPPLTRTFAFERGQWIQQDRLEGPGDRPGSAVDVDGDELAYGLGQGRGTIELYVAQRREGVWSAPSTLVMRGAPPARSGQYRSFALAGTTLAVVTRDGPTAQVYVFEKRPTVGATP